MTSVPTFQSTRCDAFPSAPFLKWAGGKRWIASAVAGLLSDPDSRYAEPFVGAGACFFARRPEMALLSDSNRDLISTFKLVRDRPGEVMRRLRPLRISRRVFEQVRSTVPQNDTQRAVRMMYLNRTAFNGLYRVNREGHFNVPFGCKSTTSLYDEVNLRACSAALKSASLATRDFREALDSLDGDEQVYCDPPYTVHHNDNCFRRYNEHLFAWSDQVALAKQLTQLVKAGARVVITNALHRDVRALYAKSYFIAFAVGRVSNMAATAARRGRCTELLLVSKTVSTSALTVREIIRESFHGPLRRLAP